MLSHIKESKLKERRAVEEQLGTAAAASVSAVETAVAAVRTADELYFSAVAARDTAATAVKTAAEAVAHEAVAVEAATTATAAVATAVDVASAISDTAAEAVRAADEFFTSSAEVAAATGLCVDAEMDFELACKGAHHILANEGLSLDSIEELLSDAEEMRSESEELMREAINDQVRIASLWEQPP